MDCVNHSGTAATAFCQNCGKALCSSCIRKAAGGQILCEQCLAAWQSVPPAYTPGFGAGPNPATAAVLGLIPGVGAMYNGQFLKGLAHLFIFAVLVSASDHFPIFGFFIAGWIFYQVFEAYHVAKARRDGLPMPDPLGLNEISNWFNPGGRGQQPGQPGAVPPVNPLDPAASAQAASGQPPPQPFESPYKDRSQWQSTYPGPTPAGSNPAAGQGFTPPGVPPPFPPMPPIPPPYFWRRKEPIGAIVLIALGVLLLLGQFDLLSGRVFEFGWPLILIALGLYLIVHRMQGPQGGPK
ncbi:MAG TPA: B-box zinc finger protein [Terracidiphilus sp.]|nr:B-box zinc finger protein [Terracidiphilus sp.]